MLEKLYNLKYEKVIFLLFIVLLVWMPLPVGSNRVWFLSIAEIYIFCLSLLLLIYYWKYDLKIPDIFKQTKIIHYLFVCYLVFIFIQLVPLPAYIVNILSPVRLESFRLVFPEGEWLVLSESFHDSFSFFIESVFYYFIFILTLLLINSKERVILLMSVIIISGLFQSMYGSLMTLSGIEYSFFFEKYASVGHATGTFVNRNHLAGYLNMVIAVGIGAIIANLNIEKTLNTKLQKIRKIVTLLVSKKAQIRIFIVICTIGLVLTHSRMGNISFFISLTLSAALAYKFSNHAKNTMLFLMVSIIIIDIFIVSSWFGLEKVANRIQQTDIVVEQRDEVALYTYNQWQDYFITGSGGGTFQYIFPKYRGYEIKSYFDHAHNDILEFASETGVIGIVLLVSIVLLSLFSAIKALSLRKQPLMIGLAFTSTMAIIALSIHSLADFNFQIPANAATFMVILALAWIARFQSFK